MWQLLFWGSLAVVAYCYLGYPTLLYIFGVFRKRRQPLPENDSYPSVCLIVSAFNEQNVIREKIENSLALEYPPELLTVMVASDGSTDDTVHIVEEYAEHGVELCHRAARRGKSAVLNEVIEQLDQDVIVFTDANAVFAPDALVKLVARFRDPAIGCVVGKLRYVERDTSPVGKAESVYWRYESRVSMLESALQRVLVANGSIFAVRRELYQSVFPEVANDFQVPIDVASRGHGVVYEPSAQAMERTTVYWQEEFARKVRIILRGMTGFTRLRSHIRGFRLWQFWSHKLLRWMVGMFMFIAVVANIMLARDSFMYAVPLAFQVVFLFAAWNGWLRKGDVRPNRFFYLPFYFTMVNAAAIIGLIKFLSGERRSVWEKAESARLKPVPQPGRAVTTPSKLVTPHVQPIEQQERERAKVAKN